VRPHRDCNKADEGRDGDIVDHQPGLRTNPPIKASGMSQSNWMAKTGVRKYAVKQDGDHHEHERGENVIRRAASCCAWNSPSKLK
jgi:hypothetical protein